MALFTFAAGMWAANAVQAFVDDRPGAGVIYLLVSAANVAIGVWAF